jgi:hypothetical protein
MGTLDPKASEARAKIAARVAMLLLVPVPSLSVMAAMFWWPGTTLGKGPTLAYGFLLKH